MGIAFLRTAAKFYGLSQSGSRETLWTRLSQRVQTLENQHVKTPIVFTEKKFKWSPEGVCETGPCVALQNHGVECRFSWSRKNFTNLLDAELSWRICALAASSQWRCHLSAHLDFQTSTGNCQCCQTNHVQHPSGLAPQVWDLLASSCISMGTWSSAANHES